MRVLLTADLQLDKAAAFGRFDDNVATLARIAAIVEDRDVEAVIIAGDVFQHRKPGIDELIAFRQWLDLLKCETILVAGNHDVRGPHLPATVELFGDEDGEPRVWTFTRPGVRVLRTTLEHPDVVVAFLPWAHPATIRARAGGDHDALADALTEVAEDLFDDVAALANANYADVGDVVPILVTHHALDGMSLPMGTPVRCLMAETILHPIELLAQGWRYVFAGHVHAEGIVTAPDGRQAFSLGPPWRHDFGERLITPAVTIFDSSEDTVERIELEDRRFVALDVAASELGPLPWFDAEGIAGAIVRVRVSASADEASRLDVGRMRRELEDAGAHVVARIELKVERATRARSETIGEAGTPLEELDAYIDANFADAPGMRRDDLRKLTAELLDEVQS